MAYQLTYEQAEIIVDNFVNQALEESKTRNNGNPCYAEATGRLRAILQTLLTGQPNPTLDKLIQQAGFNDLPSNTTSPSPLQ